MSGPSHIRTLSAADPASADFVQVLVDSFELAPAGDGWSLDVAFSSASPALVDRAGRAEHARAQRLHCPDPAALQLKEQIDRRLLGRSRAPFRLDAPGCSFRYCSGGVLPILHLLVDGATYCALFWREIFPVGWNIANGGAASLEELLNPRMTALRELAEELIIKVPARDAVYDLRSSATLAAAGPNRVRVTFDGRAPAQSDGYFLAINVEDFGIELDQIMRIDVREPLAELALHDGELHDGEPLQQIVGLFEVGRLRGALGAGATRFEPDHLYFAGGHHPGAALEAVARARYLPHTARWRTSADRAYLTSQPRWFNLCPVTRQLATRWLIG